MTNHQKYFALMGIAVLVLLAALVYIIFAYLPQQQLMLISQLEKAKQPVAEASSSVRAEGISVTAIKQTKTLTEMVKELRERTAYIECDWHKNNNINNTSYFVDSGSGELATLIGSDGGMVVVTNRHVMFNDAYGIATACYVKFPDDHGFYGPMLSSAKDISLNADDTDGGYLHNLTIAPSTGAYAMTLNQRVSHDILACKTPEQTGNSIFVIGYPSYGSSISASGLIEPTATEGIISGMDGSYYTTSAKIEHGNSGGIAIDEQSFCYVGIPTASVVGGLESLGRILPASYVVSQQ